MTPTIVVDVGNSRIKWGRCSRNQVVDAVSLPPDDHQAWENQVESWKLPPQCHWAVCGVDPARRDRLIDWLRQRGDTVCLLHRAAQLPLRVKLESPDRVGIDRLCDAVAARSRCLGKPAVIVDAGSAVTVDWLDETGAFCGGAIFPGLRLMIEALHADTALLPKIQVKQQNPALPGLTTPAAMEAGVFWAVIGGIVHITNQLESAQQKETARFLTGGDAEFLHPALGNRYVLWPRMTLEGMRIAAETLP
jgi:type III pantothenate kinase